MICEVNPWSVWEASEEIVGTPDKDIASPLTKGEVLEDWKVQMLQGQGRELQSSNQLLGGGF